MTQILFPICSIPTRRGGIAGEDVALLEEACHYRVGFGVSEAQTTSLLVVCQARLKKSSS